MLVIRFMGGREELEKVTRTGRFEDLVTGLEGARGGMSFPEEELDYESD